MALIVRSLPSYALQILRDFNFLVCGLSLHQGSTESRKTLEQIFFFKSALIILTVSTNVFHSTYLLCYLSRHQAPTNSVGPSICIKLNHSQYTIPRFTPTKDQRSRRQLSNPFTESIHIFDAVDKAKLSRNTPYRRSTAVSLEMYPLYSLA